MLAFEDRLRGPRWSPAACGDESVTRAKADDAPGVGGPPITGAYRAVWLSRAVSVV
jgi:hypothetical protein